MKKFLMTLAAAVLSVGAVQAAEFPDISVADLKKAIEKKEATVIDVNGTNAYKAGHIPTALNYEEVKSDLASKLPKDKGALVVAYCGGPSCNAYQQAAKAAKELGYTNVKHFSAGRAGWKDLVKDDSKAPAKEGKTEAKKEEKKPS